MADPFEGWAIVELMGHRRLAGFVTEHEIAGQSFLRLDIAGPPHPEDDEDDGPAVALKGGFEGGVTQFYSPQAVYCITPTTQDIAVTIGRRSQPAPVQRYELEPPKPREDPWGDEADSDDEDPL
ncbi:MAG: hypothetical protein JWO67_1106 [Streptosporangiaceae bacterium]|nr:hypothetical protein [Streptosporangiaceae bacterium]